MPSSASVIVQRHHLGLALLPGVTGRRDVFAARRAEVLAALRPALEACAGPGGTVTVVAPALVSRTTTTARPDLGASGYAPADSASCPQQGCGAPISLEPDVDQGGAPGVSGPAAEHALHVAASAAVLLVRMAGWAAEITTHEVGAGEPVASRALVAHRGTGGTGGAQSGTHLVVFACATEDGVLPVGAAVALVGAEAATHALHREVRTMVDAGTQETAPRPTPRDS